MQRKILKDKAKEINGAIEYMVYEGAPVFKEEIDKKSIKNKRKK